MDQPVARPSRTRRFATVAAGATVLLTMSTGVAFAQGRGPWRGEGGQERRHGDGAHVDGTVGTVTGSSFTVTDAKGTSVTVLTSDATTYAKTVAGTVADAAVGQRVVVRGTGDDTTFAAETIDVFPPKAEPTPPTTTPSTTATTETTKPTTSTTVAADPAPEAAPTATATEADDDEAAGKGAHAKHLSGTVLSNDGTTLTIAVQKGKDGATTTRTVTTTATTAVTVTSEAALADVTAGATVRVSGTKQADGSIAAKRVHLGVRPASQAARKQDKPRPTTSTTVAADGTTPTTAAAPEGEPGSSPTSTASAGGQGSQTSAQGRRGVQGTVASVSGSTFTVTAGGEKADKTVTVTTSDATTYLVTKAATVADAAVGTTVVVDGDSRSGATLTARRIAIVPAKAASDDEAKAKEHSSGNEDNGGHVRGTVASNDGTTLTVTTSSGTRTVATTADTTVSKTAAGTIADVVVGQKVGVRGTSTDGTTIAAEAVSIGTAPAAAPSSGQGRSGDKPASADKPADGSSGSSRGNGGSSSGGSSGQGSQGNQGGRGGNGGSQGGGSNGRNGR